MSRRNGGILAGIAAQLTRYRQTAYGAALMGKPIYLRTRREQLKLTQEDLERITGVKQNTISKLETQPRQRPLFSTVQRLANALGVHAERLQFGPDPNRPLPRRKGMAA
jgi:DNA-binding XRE family transcriptional regulator